MTTTSKIGSVATGFFVLWIGVSPAAAAHPQAEKDMSNDRGSQGNQQAIKGDSTPLRGEEEKVDETKLKKDNKNAKEEFDRNNARGQQENDNSIPPKKALQNKLSEDADSISLR